jgi:hypothetical protein
MFVGLLIIATQLSVCNQLELDGELGWGWGC